MINYHNYDLKELRDLVAKGVFDEKDITQYYGNEWWDFAES